MSENRDWLGEIEENGLTLKVREKRVVYDGYEITEPTFCVSTLQVFTGHDVTALLREIAEPLGLPNASDEEIRHSLASVAMPDSTTMRRLRRTRHGREYTEAQRVIGRDMRNLATSVKHADQRTSVKFKAEIFETSELDSWAKQHLTELTPADWQRYGIIGGLDELNIRHLDELLLRRRLKGAGINRVKSRQEIMQAYLESLPSGIAEVLSEVAKDKFIKTLGITAARYGAGVFTDDIFLKRDEVPLLVKHDDSRPDGEQILEHVTIGPPALRNNGNEETKNNLTASLRQSARAVRPRIEWKWPADYSKSRRLIFSPAETWYPTRLQVVTESSLMGTLILLSKDPEIVAKAIHSMKRELFPRSDPSNHRRLIGLIPLAIPRVESELLDAPDLNEFEARMLKRD